MHAAFGVVRWRRGGLIFVIVLALWAGRGDADLVVAAEVGAVMAFKHGVGGK